MRGLSSIPLPGNIASLSRGDSKLVTGAHSKCPGGTDLYFHPYSAWKKIACPQKKEKKRKKKLAVVLLLPTHTAFS